jgi:hypothetical protein
MATLPRRSRSGAGQAGERLLGDLGDLLVLPRPLLGRRSAGALLGGVEREHGEEVAAHGVLVAELLGEAGERVVGVGEAGIVGDEGVEQLLGVARRADGPLSVGAQEQHLGVVLVAVEGVEGGEGGPGIVSDEGVDLGESLVKIGHAARVSRGATGPLQAARRAD